MWAELWAKISSAASLQTEARDKKYTLQTDKCWCRAFPQNCLLCYFSLFRWHVLRSPQLFESSEKPELTHKFTDNSAVLFLLFGWKWHPKKTSTCSAQGSPPSAARSGQQSVQSSAMLSPRLPAGGHQTQQRQGETVLGSIHSVFPACACLFQHLNMLR